MPALNATFSSFANGGDLVDTDVVVGLRNGVNTRFTYNGGVGAFLPLTGGTMSGIIDMGNNKITNLATPTAPSDAVTKAYADALSSGTVNPGLINQIAWYQASGSTISGLTTASNSILATSAGSVPFLTSTLPAAVQANITSLGAQANALNMNFHQINNVTDPTNPQDAATRAYVDSLSSAFLPLIGGTMSGAINMGNSKITAMADPTAAQDAVTVTYLNTQLAFKL